MVDKDLINDYTEEKTCTYKNEYYSVRDNGAVFRHAKDKSKPRKYDGFWTFGIKNKQGYMYIGEHRVHIIVATAFYGENDSKKYVVDHIDTNRCNNRVENLRWLTRLENALNNPATLKKITYLCGGDIQKFLDNPSCLRDITGNNQDVSWMRTVSSDEAHAAYKKIMQWANKPIIQASDDKHKTSMGEWLFKDDYDYNPIKLVGDYKQYREKNIGNIEIKDILLEEDLWSEEDDKFIPSIDMLENGNFNLGDENFTYLLKEAYSLDIKKDNGEYFEIECDTIEITNFQIAPDENTSIFWFLHELRKRVTTYITIDDIEQVINQINYELSEKYKLYKAFKYDIDKLLDILVKRNEDMLFRYINTCIDLPVNGI